MDQRLYNQINKEIDRAIKKGLDNAKVEWKRMALTVVAKFCIEKEYFNANEFTDEIKRSPIKTHDNRAIGGIIRLAMKWGWVEKTGIKEYSKAGHLSQVQVWKSKFYGITQLPECPGCLNPYDRSINHKLGTRQHPQT